MTNDHGKHQKLLEFFIFILCLVFSLNFTLQIGCGRTNIYKQCIYVMHEIHMIVFYSKCICIYIFYIIIVELVYLKISLLTLEMFPHSY